MALRIVCEFIFNGMLCQEYLCEQAGDELPLHDHTFNHLTKCTSGEIECFTDDGKIVRCKPGDKPVEYVAGRKHGIRGLVAGAMFMNILPPPVLPG